MTREVKSIEHSLSGKRKMGETGRERERGVGRESGQWNERDFFFSISFFINLGGELSFCLGASIPVIYCSCSSF